MVREVGIRPTHVFLFTKEFEEIPRHDVSFSASSQTL
jgi:hypothetical protein